MAPSGVPVFLLFCRPLRTAHSSGVLSPLVIRLISRSIPGGWSADEIRTADTVRGADGGKCLDHTMYDGETRTFFDNDRTIVVHYKKKETFFCLSRRNRLFQITAMAITVKKTYQCICILKLFFSCNIFPVSTCVFFIFNFCFD